MVGFAGGFAQGFGSGFGMMRQARVQQEQLGIQREQVGIQREQIEAQRQKEAEQSIRKTIDQLQSQKMDIRDETMKAIENAETREQAEQAVQVLRRQYQALSTQEAALANNIIQSAQTYGFDVPEHPTPGEYIERDLSRFDAVIGSVLSASDSRSRAAQDIFAEETARQAARSQFPGADSGKITPSDAAGIISRMSEDYANTTLSPENERSFETAVSMYLRPQRDPMTDEMFVPMIPPHLQRAMDARGLSVSREGELIRQNRRPVQIEEDHQFSTLNPEDIPPVIPQGTRTLAEEALAGNISGPVPHLARWFARVPVVGQRAPEETQARQLLTLQTEQLISALQRNPRYAVAEREQLRNALNVNPAVLDTPTSFYDSIISIDKFLDRQIKELELVVEGKSDPVSGETRRHAMDSLEAMKRARAALSPPRFNPTTQADEIRNFIQSNPPGTVFIIDAERRGETPQIREIGE